MLVEYRVRIVEKDEVKQKQIHDELDNYLKTTSIRFKKIENSMNSGIKGWFFKHTGGFRMNYSYVWNDFNEFILHFALSVPAKDEALDKVVDGLGGSGGVTIERKVDDNNWILIFPKK